MYQKEQLLEDREDLNNGLVLYLNGDEQSAV